MFARHLIALNQSGSRPQPFQKNTSQLFKGIRKLSERGAVTQGARPALDHRQIMSPVIDGYTAISMVAKKTRVCSVTT